MRSSEIMHTCSRVASRETSCFWIDPRVFDQVLSRTAKAALSHTLPAPRLGKSAGADALLGHDTLPVIVR